MSALSSLASTTRLKQMEKIVVSGCYALSAILFAVLFVENFVFSSHLGLLGFREIDDLAFQATLRHMHEQMSAGHFSTLLKTSDYAYGALFWSPLALMTYPFWALSKATGLDWPLIVLPRQIQLFLALGGLYYFRESLKSLGANAFTLAVSTLLFALYPTFAYFSMRFGTINALFFFSVLSVALALKDAPSTPNGRYKIALALAAAIGIKISGLFIAPLVCLLVWRRLPQKNACACLSAAWKPTLLFLAAAITFTLPHLWAALFTPSIASHYIEQLSHFVEVTRVSHGEPLLFRLYMGFFLGSPFLVLLNATLLFGLLLFLFKERTHRLDVLFVLGELFLVVFYLIFFVLVTRSVCAYFFPVFFLLLFGARGFQAIRNGKWILLFLLLLSLGHSASAARLSFGKDSQKEVSTLWGSFFYFSKELANRPYLEESDKILSCLSSDLKGRPLHHVFIDYTKPLAMNILTHPNTCFSYAWNNLSADKAYCQNPIDYLVLDRANAVGFQSEAVFQEIFAKVDDKLKEAYKTDRANRERLLKTGRFGNQFFQKICETDKSYVFKAVLIEPRN